MRLEPTSDPFVGIANMTELSRFQASHASKQLIDTYARLTPDGVTNILRLCKAFWMHSGDSSAPHVELTSGLHSDGFIDTLRALTYTNVCDLLAYHLTTAIEEKLNQIDYPLSIEWVVGSDHAGAVFSRDVARWLGARHDFTEKGPGKTQVWKRFTIRDDEPILQVEELMTTAGTMLAVREGIFEGNPNPVVFTPLVATLVHRSDVYDLSTPDGSKEDGIAPVVYLAHYDIQTWTPENCPLCKVGSKVIKEPKKNWAALTGK